MQFQLFGFPVSIEGSFLLTLGLLGFFSAGGDTGLVVAFVVIGAISVLIHEFGHAFAARSQGVIGIPTISLAGMAGLTRYRLKEAPTRLQSIFISFAGPLTGVVLGAGVLVFDQANVLADTSFNNNLINIALFTTFGWSAFNLLPIVPLDGGHIMTDLIPGDRQTRQRRAALVSVVFSVAAGILLLVWFGTGAIFGIFILGSMAMQNITIFSKSREAARITPALTPRQGDLRDMPGTAETASPDGAPTPESPGEQPPPPAQ